MRILAPVCPVCRQRDVRPAGRMGLAPPREVRQCMACGARFVAAGGDRYRLVACDPWGVARARGLSAASGCQACIPCLTGRTLTRREWAQAAEGIHEPGLHDVDLTESEQEVTLAVSEPVYRDLGEPSYRKRPGTLVVTNRRVVYNYGDRVWEVGLEEIQAVEATLPGFELTVRGVPQPVYFFTPVGDPISRVIKRAAVPR